MTDHELERRLRTALEHAAPNDLEGVLSRCETGKGTVIDMTNAVETKKKKRRWAPLARPPVWPWCWWAAEEATTITAPTTPWSLWCPWT